jgi:hypothetical protein
VACGATRLLVLVLGSGLLAVGPLPGPSDASAAAMALAASGSGGHPVWSGPLLRARAHKSAIHHCTSLVSGVPTLHLPGNVCWHQ